jgi:hypothetical protein
MKRLSAALAVALLLAAAPASAHVVQATTSLSLTDVDIRDEPQLKQAVRSAVDEVLTNAIAFKPTLVALTGAQVVGERLYLSLLIADEEGERTLDALEKGGPGAQEGPGEKGRPADKRPDGTTIL